MTTQRPVQGISIAELMNKLKLSRNYITRNITHCIPHLEESPSMGARVLFDGNKLRRYLVSQAKFTRQTKRINIDYELYKYREAHPNEKISDVMEFLGKIPDMKQIKRGDLPTVRVNEFDFWDLPLIFPKEYTQGNDEPDAPVKSAEICYRDMFKAGAIKIQMGRQKTMFYIPEERGIVHPPLRELQKNSVDTDRYCLVPADWEPFYKGLNSKPSTLREPARIEISITGDTADIDWRYIDSALRKVFVIDRTISHSINPDKGSTNMRFMGRIPPKR